MLKNKSILKVIAVLTVMVMSISMLSGCGTKKEEKKEESFEEPIKNFVEGLGETNSQKFLNAFPSFISDYLNEIFTDDYLKEMVEAQKDEYGDNIKVSYKVTDKKEIDEDGLKEAEEDAKESYDQDIKITKGYEVEVEITTKGDQKEETDTDSIEVYEIDGKWYILSL